MGNYWSGVTRHFPGDWIRNVLAVLVVTMCVPGGESGRVWAEESSASVRLEGIQIRGSREVPEFVLVFPWRASGETVPLPGPRPMMDGSHLVDRLSPERARVEAAKAEHRYRKILERVTEESFVPAD